MSGFASLSTDLRQEKLILENAMTDRHDINLHLNGDVYRVSIEARKTLADAIREECGLTGTHIGCEHGVCGACTVIMDGVAVRSCLVFAVQANGSEVTTIEGLAAADGTLHPVQRQMLPARPSRISVSSGLGCSSRTEATDTMKPGVQKPHCRP